MLLSGTLNLHAARFTVDTVLATVYLVAAGVWRMRANKSCQAVE